jgi:hypothetical protein
MGTNNSKTLKIRFEQGHFHEQGPIHDPNLNQTKRIYIHDENAKQYPCLLRELDTAQYTQTLSKVDDFLEKMNNTSPFISSFFFITESKNKANVFNLIFESGRGNLQYSNILPVVVKVLHSVICALCFLDSIQLFYPRLDLKNIVEIEGTQNQFKLINQFCFNDFLKFITEIYLSNHLTGNELKRILENKKRQNLMELRGMVTKIVIHHPQIKQNWHFLSNLQVFELFLNEAVSRNFSCQKIKSKFEELFDLTQNSNKNHTPQTTLSYSGSKKVYKIPNTLSSQLTRDNSKILVP